MTPRPICTLTGAALCLTGFGCAAPDGPDTPPDASVRFAESELLVREGESAQATLILEDGPFRRDVAFDLAVVPRTGTGRDVVLASDAIRFPAGSSPGTKTTVPIATRNDTLVEGLERLELAIPRADVSIDVQIADDEPLARIESAIDSGGEHEVPETDSASIPLRLDLDGTALGQPVAVRVTPLSGGETDVGDDHPAFQRRVRFPSGARDGDTAPARLPLSPDLEAEENESLFVEVEPLRGPVHVTRGPIALTIRDDDQLMGTSTDGFATVLDPHTRLRDGSGLGLHGITEPVASAYDPFSERLFVVANGRDDLLLEVDDVTGAITEIGPLGFGAVRAMTYDLERRQLYAIDHGSGSLVTVDPDSGRAEVSGGTGKLGFGGIQGLAYVPGEDRLLAIDDETDQLLRVVRSTGTANAIAELPAGVYESLTFDSETQMLATVSHTNVSPALVRIAIDGNEVQPVGQMTAVSHVSSIAQIGLEMLLFDDEKNAMFVKGPSSAPELRAALGAEGIEAFADGIVGGEVYGVTRDTAILVAVDTDRGHFTTIAPLSDRSIRAKAAAMDPLAERLWLADAAAQRLVEVDPDTGEVVPVGSLTTPLHGLAFGGRKLFGTSADGRLFELDPATAETTLVGDTGLDDVEGLDHQSGRLYALARGGNELHWVKPADATSTQVGATGSAHVNANGTLKALATDDVLGLVAADVGRGALTTLSKSTGRLRTIGALGIDADAASFDPTHELVYAAELDSEWLFAIDPELREARAIGSLGKPVQALAVAGDGELYGVALAEVMTIDRDTAQTSLVGEADHAVTGMAYDPDGDVLYGAAMNALLTLDVSDGSTEEVGSFGGDFTGVQALAFHRGAGELYASHVSTQQLLSVSRRTGEAELLRSTTGRAVLGMTVVR